MMTAWPKDAKCRLYRANCLQRSPPLHTQDVDSSSQTELYRQRAIRGQK